MQELLWKYDNAPREEQEYVELRLDELGDPPQQIEDLGIISHRRFVVRQSHAKWSEIDGQTMWGNYQYELCATRRGALAKYQARRDALAAKGFIYSNMGVVSSAWADLKLAVGSTQGV